MILHFGRLHIRFFPYWIGVGRRRERNWYTSLNLGFVEFVLDTIGK